MGRRKGASSSAATAPASEDSETFEMDYIDGHTICEEGKGKDIYMLYKIKWKGFSAEHNSSETECSILSYYPVIQYWLNRMDDDPAEFNKLGVGCFMFHSLEGNFGRFITKYDVNLKAKFLEMAPKYNWEYRSGMKKLEPMQKRLFYSQYNKQLKNFYLKVDQYPLFEVYNNKDDVLPLPLSRLLLDISKEEDLFKINEICDEAGWLLSQNGLRAVIKKFGKVSVPVYDDHFPENLYQLKRMIFEKPHPKRHLLINKSDEMIWELKTVLPIKKGEKILPVFGQLVKKKVAADFFKEDHFLALCTFIDYDEEHSLDRRVRSDFTHYLTQSCRPNCQIKRFPNEKYKLHVVATEDISPLTTLSVDWFKMFSRYRFDFNDHVKLVEDRVDHIICCCQSREASDCRKVLWKYILTNKGPKSEFELLSRRFGGLQYN